MEFLLGGLAACGAGVFTNPFEVVKTRMQLQGELKARGQYAIHYRNVFHAFYAIGKVDGLLALQKGLAPALWYQLCMNGIRLGTYQCLVNVGLTQNSQGKVSFISSVGAGAFAGGVGAFFSSPIYMVKTHLQSLSNKQIAVGHQHEHTSMSEAMSSIYGQHGIQGLWRGVSAAVWRVMFGSAAQLSTFSSAKEWVTKQKVFPSDSFLNVFAASMISGIMVVIVMTPFDVVSTRIYNQKTNRQGVGTLYTGTLDCFLKIYQKEGIWGFYKGWAPSLFRIGPHTVLSLVLWDQLRKLYIDLKSQPSSC